MTGMRLTVAPGPARPGAAPARSAPAGPTIGEAIGAFRPAGPPTPGPANAAGGWPS
ncbi:hypothetical protein ACIA8E_33070 [Streptomyces sp. NPDC051664]|uniref:hypothetical protein n=1 Tax=Streptomyces sp. NPDC051664 TaxID=3365668 RepID=UPI00378A39B3